MKNSVLSAVCMLILLCFLSCDINPLNELLGKARKKSLEETTNEKNLNSIKVNQRDKEERSNILKIENKIEVNKKDLQKQEGIELAQTNGLTKLTKEQEYGLISENAKADDIKIQVSAQLSEIETIYNELTKSLSELENIELSIHNAKSDFERARNSSGRVDVNQVQALDKAIEQFRISNGIAVSMYKDKLDTLKLAKSDAEHASIFIQSALAEPEQIRSIGYYYMGHMTYYILKAIDSLNSAGNMFNQVKSNMDNLRGEIKRTKEDFATLNKAHQVVCQSLSLLGFNNK